MERPSNLRTPRLLRTAALLIACAVLSSSMVLAQDAPSLPGGASSLQDTFGDWRVACQIVDTTRRCALSQQQARQDGQRVLAIELQSGPDNTVTGNLILPFGLLLNAGVSLQIDEQSPMDTQFFRTCLPAGRLHRAGRVRSVQH